MPSVVLLPAPLWPSRPKISPLCTSSERSCTAGLPAKAFRKQRSSIIGKVNISIVTEGGFPVASDRMQLLSFGSMSAGGASPLNGDYFPMLLGAMPDFSGVSTVGIIGLVLFVVLFIYIPLISIGTWIASKIVGAN